MGLHRGGQRSTGDTFITRCKLCPYGVFGYQAWVWLCDKMIGITHASCVVDYYGVKKYEEIYGKVPEGLLKAVRSNLLLSKKPQRRQKTSNGQNASNLNIQSSSIVSPEKQAA